MIVDQKTKMLLKLHKVNLALAVQENEWVDLT